MSRLLPQFKSVADTAAYLQPLTMSPLFQICSIAKRLHWSPFAAKFSCLQIILQGTLQRWAVYATNFPTENFNLNVFLVRQRIITAQQEKA
jgi:hypothetical protein